MSSKGASKAAVIDRRTLLRNASATAATAALFSAIKASFPGGAFAQGAGPEVKGTKLGYIALTDAAPLIVAKEIGWCHIRQYRGDRGAAALGAHRHAVGVAAGLL